ncbi:AMP-dependent synthetase/ligase [Cellulomonas denverensis]|uniref:Acyl-CoA synthetase n=1 Tax=Cellulomonas denverensis TaxID=264297 RepID=A0A7X6QZL7_9CELL|nr:AMP-dependent synthetase/ligase [Cellulomonas denverensis]NKY23275.1 long-chain fatty acid--CoA ligase [Cellulomonas denverensis]GIG26393.1 long-chain-fatty-acid--CoA ligase [Cellulomonas denverensis]
MEEFSTPLLLDAAPEENLLDLLDTRVAATGDGPLIERRGAGGDWTTVSARSFADQVARVARGFIARGVAPGDRVGIMSRTRYEWTLLDWALWTAGAVPVPVYETSSAEQVHWILTDADVTLLVVETAEHAALVEEVRPEAPHLREVLVLDDGAVDALAADADRVDAAELAARRRYAGRDDLATIIYTSGTTGRPKGVELTHGNFSVLTRNAVEGLKVVVSTPGARTLLFMPLAHVFARFVEVLCMPAGAVLGHTPDTKTLLADLATFKPTFILSVPRVFEKVYNSAEQKAAAGGKLRIFQWAARTAIAYSRALDEGRPSLGLRLQHAVADRLVFHKLREAMGGRIEWAISGGAPLGERLGHFFRGIGVRILEGYGLTETTAPAVVNLPDATRIGTVGPPLPGTSVRIAADGEVEIRGPQVFRRYHRNPTATAESLSDGWFRTGDLGSLDQDGYLRITGRKKEIIVTAGGKNVAPAVLEDRLRAHPLVSQVVVVGDGRPFIAALVTLDAEGLPGWCAAQGRAALTVAEARTDPQVIESLDKAVERANRAVSRAESIRTYRILERDLTIQDGYLTPKLSVRRTHVLKDFATDVEALYAGTPPAH